MCSARLFAADPLILPLYPNGAPDDNGITAPETWVNNNVSVRQVSVAQIHLYRAENPNGRAVVICPGGGYGALAMHHEGEDVARWMNGRGITAVVLKYRMPNGHDQIPIGDLHEAIRTVRTRAAEWRIDPAKVGVMGFSAGGHLAATGSVMWDEATRPAFSILIYPVTSFDESFGHIGSRNNLVGQPGTRDPAQYAALIEKYSPCLHVDERTPTTFLALSDDDKTVNPLQSTLYYNALNKHKVPAEMHIYPKGGHGWGWRTTFAYHDELCTSLSRWLGELDQ